MNGRSVEVESLQLELSEVEEIDGIAYISLGGISMQKGTQIEIDISILDEPSDLQDTLVWAVPLGVAILAAAIAALYFFVLRNICQFENIGNSFTCF